MVMLDGQIEFLWNLHEAPDGHLVSYIVMTCVVQTQVYDVVILIDSRSWIMSNDILMEPSLCWWKTLMNMHGHESIIETPLHVHLASCP